MENDSKLNIKGALEAMLFISEDALKVKQAATILGVEETIVVNAFEQLSREYDEREAGIVLKNTAAGWKFYTHPMYHEQLCDLILSWDTRKLSQAALETLAIIAYHQPVTRNAISNIRGVNSDGPVSSLAEKGLITEAGKMQTGAVLYKTTQKFLQEFGLSSIKDLPALDEFAVDKDTIETLRARLGFSEEYMIELDNAQMYDNETGDMSGNEDVTDNDFSLDDGIDNIDDVSQDDEVEDIDDIINSSITDKFDEGIELVD